MSAATALRTRPPTGKVSPPLVLVEGGEKSGKSYAAAIFSSSPRVGRVLWLDIGEGAADEYAVLPGARYEVIEHDGSYRSIYEQVCAARDEAVRAAAANEPPVVLVIDSMTALWELLKEWIDGRARKRPKNRAALAQDLNAEIDLTTDLWNDATGRWRAVMTKLMTFPGPVIAIARGKEVIEIGSDGKPGRGKDYKVEGQKHLPYDATVWVRMSRDDGARIIGARSVHIGVRPGDRPQRLPDDWTLDRLIFDDLRYRPGVVRDFKATGHVVEERAHVEDLRERALTRGVGRAELLKVHAAAKAAGLLDVEVQDGDGRPTTLGRLIVARGAEVAGQGQAVKPTEDELADRRQRSAPVQEEQHRHMHALWKSGGIEDRGERLDITNVLLGRLERPVTSSKELTAAEAETIIAALRGADRGTGALYKACSGWLDEAAAHHEAAQAGQGDTAGGES